MTTSEEAPNDALDEVPFDGREMLMVHNMFRREFGLMPRVVRGVAAGDRARAQLVADHIANVSAVLHHHHHSEDLHNWPLLRERGGAEVAAVIALMEAQHEELDKAATDVDAATEAWRATADVEARDALADALDTLLPLLREHMTTEETTAVPLMERHITAAEWNRVVQTAAAGADLDSEGISLSFGMLMYEGDPEIVDAAIANMPPEARPLIRKLAADAFAAQSELIHGTATPPRSTQL
ncbi:hemerythrin domain-containing protein [Saccharopolyspora sp. K220]|uniref:hemerythrin domain-containing protein n=1 Tax=Saccharopolyspora soli TaxID=2926618 RepID=UPI001F57E7D8|nr:hemerythrin domain-containing protein [Saccharopolyspora soli]MCI2423844.1 hemerythrin domain-containing protein [Saccharopolyspora soli]